MEPTSYLVGFYIPDCVNIIPHFINAFQMPGIRFAFI